MAREIKADNLEYFICLDAYGDSKSSTKVSNE